MKRAVLFLGWMGLWMLQGCGKSGGEPTLPPRPVITERVGEPVYGRVRTFTGVTRGEVETPISFRVDGELVVLSVNPGDEVEAGDLLARIDTTDYELQMRRQEAQLSLTEVQVRQAVAEFERIQALFEARNVSRSDYDRVVAARDAAEAQRETAREGLNFARRQVELGTLRAPRGGTAISVPVSVFQSVRAGMPVVMLRTEQSMVLEITVAETLVGSLEMGQAAEVELEAFPGRTFPGEVSEISGGVSGMAALPVRIRMGEMPEGLRSGQTGVARMVFEAVDAGRVRVPLAAVTGQTGGRRFVWVVDEGGERAVRREVVVGDLVDGMLEISEGVLPGERIVVRGANRLTEGQRIRVLEDGE